LKNCIPIFLFLLLIFSIAPQIYSQDFQIYFDCTSFIFNSFIEIGFSYFISPFWSVRFNIGYSIAKADLFLFEFGFTKYSAEFSGLFFGIDFGLSKWDISSVDFGGYLFNMFLGYRIKFKNFFIDPGVVAGIISQSLYETNELIAKSFVGIMIEVGYIF